MSHGSVNIFPESSQSSHRWPKGPTLLQSGAEHVAYVVDSDSESDDVEELLLARFNSSSLYVLVIDVPLTIAVTM